MKRSLTRMTELLGHMRITGNISEAARRVGISRCLAYEWYRISEEDGLKERFGEEELPLEFHKAWDEALEEAADSIETEIQRRGLHGYDEPIVHQGAISYKHDPTTGEVLLDDNGSPIPLTIRKYSDRMLEILAKARRPNKFRENVKMEVSADKPSVIIVPAALTMEEWSEKYGAPIEEVDPDTDATS